ncbi:MAG: thioredoxin TrxC [Gammaproteobacteria bacterium]|jgi:thioredoxin 2|nr:thioredoxin TrxC [Gammaproteobacteria bacterium]
MTQPLHVVCPRCDAVNRVPTERLGEEARCGKCRSALFSGAPLALDEGRFPKHLGRGDLSLVVDFWAPWCGPCRAMAPAFEAVARRIEPRARLVKVNTEENQGLAQRYGIRSIPTLVVFKAGKEAARTSGAMDAGSLENWIRRAL